jgi:putative DNA methylase
MATKKEQLAQDVAKAVGAGKAVAMETVDFNDPNRPKTCLEVDFPILPVNQVAIIEGNAGKPIYQMSKWWARRRSSIFRSMLIAAATKAPDDTSHAAKHVWDNYYANHQKKGAFKSLKVADIFMGGGTTLVEGSRLGMQMFGNDLNPVAWFIVKQEFADVDLEEVKKLLAEIEAEVKPQIMPYYCCEGPNGEKGKWTHIPAKTVMGPDFDPLSLTVGQRPEYSYEGPEIIYTFWAKHGPCQVTGCGHRTPIMSSPVMALKTLSVKYWEHTCSKCGTDFHIEQDEARMASDVPLFVAASEYPYSVLDPKRGIVCPHCSFTEMVKLGKTQTKKVELSLLVHPQWLAGSAKSDANGLPYGGSAQDDAESTARWDAERASKIRLLEVRGALPEEVTCPETGVAFFTDQRGGTVPKRSYYTCGACGTVQGLLPTVKATGKTGPMAGYAIQGYAPVRDGVGFSYGGRFFAPYDADIANQYDAAAIEWEARKDTDLADYWPRTAVPYGFMTAMNNGDIRLGHAFTHWWTMFNPRQLLVLSQLLKSIETVGDHDADVREFVLAAFQQYLRNQNLFCFWDIGYDKLVPHMSNNNYHPKATPVENCVFGSLGRGNWTSCIEGLLEGREWALNPWDQASVAWLKASSPTLSIVTTAKAEKVYPSDPVLGASVLCGSASDLDTIGAASIDLVVTDPPFGGLLHYSELSDFFYSWLRIPLSVRYPDIFTSENTPKALEAVSNKAREPEDSEGFYKRILTQCWREANRVLKPGGILAFTFHHSEDEPWVAVLESLFEAGFYLETAYPIRSDETKGEGSKPGTFGSQQIEYDIIHVCRKRTEEPTAVSWGRMRREVLADVRHLQATLENHAKQGLPLADLQVIKRGKALEYFSRHYGKVYVDEGRSISVKDALVGINQLIDEDSNKSQEPPPVNAEPITRQFLRIFDGKLEVPRDQMHKFLRGSGLAPDEFAQRGWCNEKSKIFTQVDPLAFAQEWHGRHRRRLTSDLDQSLVLVGACFDNSGINASDTLNNENFKPHAALKPLLDWLSKRGATSPTRNAASRALTIYNNWAATHEQQVRQMSLFLDEA